jgi:hypothetical protein
VKEVLSGANITGDRVLDSGLASALTSAAQAAATGGDTVSSAAQGFLRGASTAAQTTKEQTPTTISGGTITVPGASGTDTAPGGAAVELPLPGTTDVLPLQFQTGAQTGTVVQTGGGETLQPRSIGTQAEAIQQNYEYPLADYYRQANGTTWVVDRVTGQLTQYRPGEGAVSAVSGGGLQRAGEMIGAESQLPADAQYVGSLKTFDPTTAAEGPSSSNFQTMAIVGELDPNAPKFNLQITKNADGSTTQVNTVTGDRVTFTATGQIDPARTQYSALTQATQAVGTGAGLVQEALGEYGN